MGSSFIHSPSYSSSQETGSEPVITDPEVGRYMRVGPYAQILTITHPKIWCWLLTNMFAVQSGSGLEGGKASTLLIQAGREENRQRHTVGACIAMLVFFLVFSPYQNLKTQHKLI